MRFSVLASGSEGNACYVETAHTRLLIDAGLSCRELIRRLELVDVNPETLDALVVTHEHTDHVKGAGPLARLLGIPVYMNHATLRRSMRILGNLSVPMTVHTGQTITINDLAIETFTKCHDAVDPVGVVVGRDGRIKWTGHPLSPQFTQTVKVALAQDRPGEGRGGST